MTTQRTADPIGSIDSTELRILHALATTGSLTAAAGSLGLSQPAVSQRIKRVETRLAVPLIERSGRGIRLTTAGQILADHGRTVVAEIDAALAAIDDLRGERAGTLRMVGFPSASATLVPDLMRRLAAEAPDVALQYREAEPPAAAGMLRDGEVDCALIFDYEGAAELPAGSAYLPLWREEVKLVVSDDRQVEGESAKLGDFSHEHWIAGCEKCRGHLLSAAGEAGFEPDIIQETDNVPAMLAMAAAGGAVALVPGLALAAARTLPDDARALPLDPPRYRTIGIVSMATANESPQVRLAKRLLAGVDGARWGLEVIA
ncbi:LysR family transcriptional regulator [Leucobacter chromiireducens]|uniref:LysR family transcriptional regulator n=1 Tax=Leucobacter chromiireducens subsp. chromiireducens TaxID=660067 RepID=A0ABS1SPH4_9MICO|nr:LysR substrate-binding domain-containing protein [Leucobacter chromiireducens]MBL3690056.1 LysR family transcriptional regulator [Leucobacter chromiireducens subsp. chromiireducens]